MREDKMEKDMEKDMEKQLQKRFNAIAFWEPKMGESYYYLTFWEKDNHILCGTHDDKSGNDTPRLRFGNCFRTKEDAKRAIPIVKIALSLAKLRTVAFDSSTVLEGQLEVLERLKSNYVGNSDGDLVVVDFIEEIERIKKELIDGRKMRRENDGDVS